MYSSRRIQLAFSQTYTACIQSDAYDRYSARLRRTRRCISCNARSDPDSGDSRIVICCREGPKHARNLYTLCFCDTTRCIVLPYFVRVLKHSAVWTLYKPCTLAQSRLPISRHCALSSAGSASDATSWTRCSRSMAVSPALVCILTSMPWDPRSRSIMSWS